MPSEEIRIKGAAEHNLKRVDLVLPRDRLIVFTGLSGSGKSSLAFDTIYAEGQRRYVESLSAYARQFLELMEKPDVELIEGLSPAISIEQKTTSRNPRSTVGTVTEIHDYLRVLFARIGEPHCHQCRQPITAQTVQQITDTLLAQAEKTRLTHSIRCRVFRVRLFSCCLCTAVASFNQAAVQPAREIRRKKSTSDACGSVSLKAPTRSTQCRRIMMAPR